MLSTKRVDRIEYIDYARAIGIILVVAGHINSYNGFCKVWIYSFHMPLFFLLSGMTLKSAFNFASCAFKRVKRLLVPYFIWAFIYSELSINNILYICYGSYKSLSMANSLTSLWFFPVLFLSYIASEFIFTQIEKYFKNNENICLIMTSAVFLILGFALPNIIYGYPFGLNVAFSAAGFMFIGKCLFNLFQMIRSGKTYILMFVIIITFIVSFGAYFNIPDSGSEYILMADSQYNNPVLFLVVALAGSGFIICIAILIENMSLPSINKILSYLGRNTLAIMVLQKPVISVIERILHFLSIPEVIILMIICIIVLIICCGFTWIINKIVPQIIGN